MVLKDNESSSFVKKRNTKLAQIPKPCWLNWVISLTQINLVDEWDLIWQSSSFCNRSRRNAPRQFRLICFHGSVEWDWLHYSNKASKKAFLYDANRPLPAVQRSDRGEGGTFTEWVGGKGFPLLWGPVEQVCFGGSLECALFAKFCANSCAPRLIFP